MASVSKLNISYHREKEKQEKISAFSLWLFKTLLVVQYISMALDNITLDIITEKLKSELEGTRFSNPMFLGGFDYGFPYGEVRSDDKKGRHGTFVFSLNPTNPFLCYSYDRFTKVNDNSPFFNGLRKLALATVTKVEKIQGERIILIHLKANPNDLTEINTGYDLIIEMFPNHPNVLTVAYPYGKIVSLYKERTNLEKGLFIARNTTYSMPSPREKLPLDVSSLEETKPYLNNNLFKHLTRYVQDKKIPLSKAVEELMTSKDIYIHGKEILPLSFGLEDIKKVGIENVYSTLVEDQKELAKKDKEKELLALIEKAIKVNEKKLINLNMDLEEAKEHMVYLEWGQEIYLYQGEIKKGDTLLEKDGYSIPLDPRFDAPNNANRYFKRYQKAKSAIQILQKLIVKAKEDHEYLLKKQLEAGDGTPRDIMELKSELLEEGYIKEAQGKKNNIKKVNHRKAYEPHYLKVLGGKIGFGMNGLQNEELTFNVATKDDLFIHVKDYPGSHIVVLEGKDNQDVVELAMELALYLSHLDSGEVYLAKRKYVKKNQNRIGLVNILKYEIKVVKYIRPESIAIFKKELKNG